MKVNIKRIDSTLPLPVYETSGSFAFDFITRQDTTIPPKEMGMIPTNVIVKCPPDHALLTLPRSSTYRKKKLLFPNSAGLIDADYCGSEDEIHILVLNMDDQPVTIQRGEKIAQGLFIKVGKAQWEEVEDIAHPSRGGFGSTDQT